MVNVDNVPIGMIVLLQVIWDVEKKEINEFILLFSKGYLTSPRTTGTYFVNTRDKAPFCGYHYVISFRILADLPDPKKTVTAGEIIFKVDNEEAYLTE